MKVDLIGRLLRMIQGYTIYQVIEIVFYNPLCCLLISWLVSGFLISGCKSSDESIEKNCTKPLVIEATANPQNPFSYDFSLAGGKVTDIARVQWRFGGSDDPTPGPYAVVTKAFVNKSTQTIIAEITTTCNDQLILKYTLTIDQPVIKVWDKTIGGRYSEYLPLAIATSDGGYILFMQSKSDLSDEKSEYSRGGFDYWVVKVNANGIKEWDKSYGGKEDDYITAAVQTTDGGYLLAGYSNSDAFGEKSENVRGESDYWIVKISANGTKQWDRTLGGDKFDLLTSAVQTSDGGYLLAGVSSSSKTGEKSENARGRSDYWIIKVNASGVKQWDKTFGGFYDDRCNAVVKTPDGGYLLGGYSESGIQVEKSEVNRGGSDYWVVKIDANGAKQWDRTFGGANLDRIYDLALTSDGGYMLGGVSQSNESGDRSSQRYGSGSDYWIIKIDANGAKQWDKSFGGNRDNSFNSLISTPDGGYLLGGTSDSEASGLKSEKSRGSYDYWLVKITAEGVKQWDKTIGGNDAEYLNELITTSDGGYLIAGMSLTSEISSEKSERGRGEYDGWIVKIK